MNNDRSQGGSSQDVGEIELMFHRKALRDDAKGMDEGVNEDGFDYLINFRDAILDEALPYI